MNIKPTNAVTVLKKLQPDSSLSNTFVVVVGRRDGKVDYLTVPSFENVGMSGILFPGQTDESANASLDNLDEIFTSTTLESVPVSLCISPNFLYHFALRLGDIESVGYITVDGPKSLDWSSANEKSIEQFASFILLWHLNGNDLQDVTAFLKQFPEGFLIKMTCIDGLSRIVRTVVG